MRRASPHEEIGFPVTRYRAIGDVCRSFPNRHDVHFPLPNWCGATGAAHRGRSAQLVQERPLEEAAALDEEAAIDGFMRHVHVRIAWKRLAKPVGDLLWRPLQGELLRDQASDAGMRGEAKWFRAATPVPGAVIRARGAIVGSTPIPAHFAAHRGWWPTQLATD